MGMFRGGGRCFAFWGAFLCAGLGVARANAATIVVNHAGAANEASCNLEQAVAAANADVAVGGCAAGSGADSIVLLPGSIDPEQEWVPELDATLHITEDLVLNLGGSSVRVDITPFVVEEEVTFELRDATLIGWQLESQSAVLVEPSGSLRTERLELLYFSKAVRIEPGASATFVDTFFHHNHTSDRGAALDCGGTCDLNRVTFWDNVAEDGTDGFGGAIAARASSDLHVSNGTFVNNTTSCGFGCFAGGGAIRAAPGANARVDFSTFAGNGFDGYGPVQFKASRLSVGTPCWDGASSAGHNVFLYSGAGCGAVDTDLATAYYGMYASLEYRGGFVPVVDVEMGEPVREAVPGCLGFDGVVNEDAAGRARPQGAACDAGAREALTVPELELTFDLPSPYWGGGTTTFSVPFKIESRADLTENDVLFLAELSPGQAIVAPEGCAIDPAGEVARCEFQGLAAGTSITFDIEYEIAESGDRDFVAGISRDYRPYVNVEETLHVRYCGDSTVDPEEACEPSLSEHCSSACACEEGWEGADCATPVMVGTGGAGGEGGLGGEAGAPPLGGAGDGGEGARDSGGAGGSASNGGSAGTHSSGGNASGGRASGGTAGSAAGGVGGEPEEPGAAGSGDDPETSDGDRHSKGCACGVATVNRPGLGWLSVGLAGVVWWRRARRTMSPGREPAH